MAVVSHREEVQNAKRRVQNAEFKVQSSKVFFTLRSALCSLRSALYSLRSAHPFSVHLFGFSGLLRICCYFGRNDRHRRQNVDRAGINVDQIWINDDRAGMNVEPGEISFCTQNNNSGTESGFLHHEGHEEPRK